MQYVYNEHLPTLAAVTQGHNHASCKTDVLTCMFVRWTAAPDTEPRCVHIPEDKTQLYITCKYLLQLSDFLTTPTQIQYTLY